jgi:hypothetical protein
MSVFTFILTFAHNLNNEKVLLAFNLKSLNNNASALNEARSQSAGVPSALKNV